MSNLDFAGMRAFCSFYEKKLKADEELDKLPPNDGASLHNHYISNPRQFLKVVGFESRIAFMSVISYQCQLNLSDEDAKYLYDKYMKLLEVNNQREQDLFLGDNI